MSGDVIELNNSAGVVYDGEETFMDIGWGKLVSTTNPTIEDVDIYRIANSISKQCRYNGNCTDFYSVAEHQVLGSDLAFEMFGEGVSKEFLVHDCSEHFVSDIVRPLKIKFPIFEEVEKPFNKLISEYFGVPYPMSPECKHIDNIMIVWEKRDIMPNSTICPGLPDISKMCLHRVPCWDWETARDQWLEAVEVAFDLEL